MHLGAEELLRADDHRDHITVDSGWCCIKRPRSDKRCEPEIGVRRFVAAVQSQTCASVSEGEIWGCVSGQEIIATAPAVGEYLIGHLIAVVAL